MKAFIAGNGSMGMRRERDLRALGVEAKAYDAWPSRGLTPEQVTAFDAADLVVVSTPPTEHARVAFWAKDAGKPCFTEADVVQVRSPHFPSCTPRFVPEIHELRLRLAAGEFGTVAAYTHHTGQHLLDWHPGADLRSYYAAQRATGACREMVPFELCWLTWLFGPVVAATGLQGRSGVLPSDIDDVYQVVVAHQGGVLGHILIDALARPMLRRITVVGSASTCTLPIRFAEGAYLEEMRFLVSAVESDSSIWPYAQAEEDAALQVLTALDVLDTQRAALRTNELARSASDSPI